MNYQRGISAAMMERKKLCAPLHLDQIEEEGRFAGYASIFTVLDSQKDIMMPGAFKDTIQGRAAADVKLLWQHEPSEPVGVITHLREDERGLYVEGKLLLSVQRAKETHDLLKAGAMSGLSIGYSPLRYKIDPESGVRYLLSVQLWEVSFVTFPANQAAGVTLVKQQHVTSTGVIPPWQAIPVMDAIDKALHNLRSLM